MNSSIPLVFLVLVFLQITIGAFVSGMDAGTVYNTWPLMGSSYFPDDSKFIEFMNFNVFDNPSIVQFVHRNLAYLIVIIYIYLLILVFRDTNKIFRVGWPMEYMNNLLFDLGSEANKHDMIIFPHRLAPEKQVDIFKDLSNFNQDCIKSKSLR